MQGSLSLGVYIGRIQGIYSFHPYNLFEVFYHAQSYHEDSLMDSRIYGNLGTVVLGCQGSWKDEHKQACNPLDRPTSEGMDQPKLYHHWGARGQSNFYKYRHPISSFCINTCLVDYSLEFQLVSKKTLSSIYRPSVEP